MRTPLSGPFSPLEHKMLCAYRHGAGKMAMIDQESVNKLLLDRPPVIFTTTDWWLPMLASTLVENFCLLNILM